jgi:hypothetical protein
MLTYVKEPLLKVDEDPFICRALSVPAAEQLARPRSGEEPVISIAEARRTMASALGASMEVCEPEQAQHSQQQQAQRAQHAHQAQHAAPLMRTVSAAELRSMAGGGAMRMAPGTHVRDAQLYTLSRLPILHTASD